MKASELQSKTLDELQTELQKVSYRSGVLSAQILREVLRRLGHETSDSLGEVLWFATYELLETAKRVLSR